MSEISDLLEMARDLRPYIEQAAAQQPIQEQTAEEWPAWSQPVGAHDAYAKGDKVSHNGKHWTSGVDSNVWEPGVYGWTEATE